MDTLASGYAEHPQRRELHDELHARPSLYFNAPADVWHIALLAQSGDLDVPSHLLSLPGARKTQDGRHGIAPLGRGRLKWERHTEFLTLTYIAPFTRKAHVWPEPPTEIVELGKLIPAQRIAAVQVVVADEDVLDPPIASPQFADWIASEVGGSDATVISNFQMDEHGYVRILLANRRLDDYRTGRMVRRLLEIETYRMMALLGLPLTREAAKKLYEFDGRLNALMEDMQGAQKVDKALLSEVTKLSSDVINFMAVARDRFSATAAYAEIVAQRISELREERLRNHQRVGVFIDRRFRPAVRSCEVAERRLENLASRVSRASDLLRTSVQVELEEQNAFLLSSMEQRARTQIKIQQAVEGFSIIAISYYSLGLLKMALDSLTGVGIGQSYVKSAMLIALPIFLLVVWRAVRHVRKAISGELPR